MYDVENIQQIFQTYAGATMFLPVFLACVIYAFCRSSETGRKRILFLFVWSILFVFNGFALKLLGKVTDAATFYRFIWAVPILPLIAWAGTKAVMEREKRWERAAVLCLLACLFWCGKSSFITEGSIRIPENTANVPEDVVEVCKIIDGDKKKERPVVIFDYECQMWARLCDPSLVWGIRREAYQYYNDMEDYRNAGKYKQDKLMLQAVSYGAKDNLDKLSNALEKRDVDYIVAPTGLQMDAYLEGAGYSLLDTTGFRSVYVRNGEARPEDGG